jgi:glyoxylase-like metal-dependent hydrolase (beta-lactamase superfamily II)
MEHCSLLVKTKWGRLIVTGDAAMTDDFFQAEEGFHNSVDFEQATKTIREIKNTADLIIPGHGNFILNHKG